MSRKINSLLIKSAHIQSHIERERGRSKPDWIMVLRLKLVRLRLKNRLRALSVVTLRPPVPAAAVARAGA